MDDNDNDKNNDNDNDNMERSEEYVERCRHDIIKKLIVEKNKTKSRPQGKDADSSNEVGVDHDDVEEDKDEAEEMEDFDEKFHILLSTVRALTSTNNEIWERCQPYIDEQNSDGSLIFYRIGYNNVRASKSFKSNKMEFWTMSQLETKHFQPFSSLPETLSKILPVETNGTFLKYDDYLVKITWLAKPIAYQFLSIFKEHLENIQLDLGKIETWITEPRHSLQFINTQFGMDLDIPTKVHRSKRTLKKVDVKPTLRSLEVSFECSSESDQESLKHFIQFVQCRKSDEEHNDNDDDDDDDDTVPVIKW